MRDRFSVKPTEAADGLSILGAHLRMLREAQGLSYDDVAKSTHVRPHILKAIEEGRIEAEAAPVYARGFTKTYCEFLMAMDLWKKYSGALPEESRPPGQDSDGTLIELNPPTPMFRRSSIIWVYIMLVIAVLGAAYLLWNQHSDPGGIEFPLRITGNDLIGDAPMRSSDLSPDAIASALSYDIPLSQELGIFSYDVASANITSGDLTWSAAPGIAASASVTPSGSGDLSWMNSGASSPSVDLSPPPVPQPVPVRIKDRRLRIVITGRENNLIVEQNGKVVTRRRLSNGGAREYDVRGDTSVSLSVGSAAEITWFGKKYEQVGLDANPLALVFHPDGTVSVKSGNTAYFSDGAPVL
ncbi:MAG: helix-turn-helix domain-containing protein [Synergistaceae bacterium]|nr:helix-turn-helix domain-containing protein [Synergistaceae bacterium]